MEPFDRETTLSRLGRTFSQRYQLLLDLWTPHVVSRWVFSLVILLLFMARVVLAHGWYMICYGLGIYYLNLLIGFLSPRIDPEFRAACEDTNDSGPSLPTRVNDEFKPFIRKLPEFKFWHQASRATLVSLCMSLFDIFDLPVFWPILLVYFIILTFFTMHKQIHHMWKYRYVPWNRGKTRYGERL